VSQFDFYEWEHFLWSSQSKINVRGSFKRPVVQELALPLQTLTPCDCEHRHTQRDTHSGFYSQWRELCRTKDFLFNLPYTIVL